MQIQKSEQLGFVCVWRGGVGKEFFLDLWSWRYLWNVKVEMEFSLEPGTNDEDLKIIFILVARAMEAYFTHGGKYIEK